MTAVWTANRTWTAGEVVTAAIMNQYVRDNLDYLKARPVALARDLDGTVSNTTSTSFTDITGASVSITTSGSSRLLVIANVTWSESSAAGAYLTVLIDGVNGGDATNGVASNSSLTTASMTVPLVFLTSSAQSDGAHTVKLQYRTSANTLTVTQFSMVVLEVY